MTNSKNALLENLPFIKNVLVASVIVGLVVSCTNYFLSPVKKADDRILELKEQVIILQQEVISIKENHLAHLTTLISENKKVDDEQNQKLEEINNNVIKLLTIINNNYE